MHSTLRHCCEQFADRGNARSVESDRVRSSRVMMIQFDMLQCPYHYGALVVNTGEENVFAIPSYKEVTLCPP